MSAAEKDAIVVTPATLRDMPLPSASGGKNQRGRALVVGGSVPNPGGALLAAESALRVGAGKIQLVTAQPVAVPMAVRMPEAMVQAAPATDDGDLDERAAAAAKPLAEDAAAILVGPGLLDPEVAARLVGELVQGLEGKNGPTLVIDALALAWVTEDPERLQAFDGRAVLSPNLSELALTLSEDEGKVGEDIPGAVRRLATRTGAVVVSGAEQTYVADPQGSLWRIDVGGPGLAVAGSGDVKAGVILGLCARGVEPAHAAVWGAYVHGSAGQRLSANVGPTGFLAHELTAEIPRVLHPLQS